MSVLERKQTVLKLLEQLRGVDALKELFWTELSYERENKPLSVRGWPDSAKSFIADDPILFATGGQDDSFHVIYTRLNTERMMIGAERSVTSQFLKEHPYALFIFSNEDRTRWRFLNVKYDKETTKRRLFRRITVGPEEHLRTAAERISILDMVSIGGDMFGLSPLAIQSRHDEAFDVEAVTREFYRCYREVFEGVEAVISGIPEADRRRLFTQRLLNRLMFIAFIQKKGWLHLNGRSDYLDALWSAYQKEQGLPYRIEENNFYYERLKPLFFLALNTPNDVNLMRINRGGFLAGIIGNVPYLNGGLFEKDADDENEQIAVPDAAIKNIIHDLFNRFNFTVTESTPLDVEVAVDPEMLGKIFEELVTGRHETGSFYTPKPVVSFMCREALKGCLRNTCPWEEWNAVDAFVDEHNAAGLHNAEMVLEALRTLRACDPACGSGAYLVGMLHELLDLRAALFVTRGLDSLTLYQRKLDIIQSNLYGTDIDPFAVNIARLRLWLSLIVDFEGDDPPPLPNLDFKIEVGDSLTAPDPSGGLQLDLFRQQHIKEYYSLKADYLMAHGEEKKSLRNRIQELRSEISTWVNPGDRSKEEDGNVFDWAVEFTEVFAPDHRPVKITGGRESGGFDIVLANPPYVRADTQHRHVENEKLRQQEIALWRQYRQRLKRSQIYETLYEKWDLYIPFLERAWQLLRPQGQMVFIIPDAYNAAKYAAESHRFFLEKAAIMRLDFCSEIPLFEAGVSNTIVHFARALPGPDHKPFRIRRWGDKSDDFDTNTEYLPTAPQLETGVALFKVSTQREAIPKGDGYVELGRICYISYGLRANADDRCWQGEFTTDDCLSSVKDSRHPKPFVQGKDLAKWCTQRIWYLEWGTSRAPKKFSRPTFPELHEAKEKLVAVRTPGKRPRVIYDDENLHFDASSVGFIPWHLLQGVINRSINKTAKYRHQQPSGDREVREALSLQFHLKYILAVMNSSFACDWLAARRRSKLHVYPDDWKQLPIAPLSPAEQEEFVRLVDAILSAKSADPTADTSTLEREIERMVYELYGLTEEG